MQKVLYTYLYKHTLIITINLKHFLNLYLKSVRYMYFFILIFLFPFDMNAISIYRLPYFDVIIGSKLFSTHFIQNLMHTVAVIKIQVKEIQAGYSIVTLFRVISKIIQTIID